MMKTSVDSRTLGSADRSIQRRDVKQDRSISRQRKIAEGAVLAISRYGVSGVTHRRIAQQAHVSLAATTYYYESKDDVIADASRTLLKQYVDAFHRFADRHRDNVKPMSLRDFALKLVRNGAGKNNIGTIAWCEIMLNIARRPNLRHLSNSYFGALGEVWREIADLLQTPESDTAIASAIDTVIGFLFLIVPLGLPEATLDAILSGKPVDNYGVCTADEHLAESRVGKKAVATRKRILDAASEILVADGADGLTFRRVSDRAGLTVAAPTYHFSTMSVLLNAAQLRLFEDSKERYRAVMAGIDYSNLATDTLVDLTTTVFLREATEFRSFSLACYPVYIQSSRDTALRAGLWSINVEQHNRWMQVLAAAQATPTELDAWVMYANFTGKLVRILATGGEMNDLSKVRSEFAYDISNIVSGCHWSQAP